MLEFEPLQLEDMDKVNPYLQTDGLISSGRTFASLYIWGEHYQTCFTLRDDILFLRSCFQQDTLSYYMPLGKDLKKAIEVIRQDAGLRSMSYDISLVTEAGKEQMEQDFPGQYRYEEMRSQFEYIYNAEDLIGLKGKRYHGKRNFINRFQSRYGGMWEYQEVEVQRDYDEILAFVRQWCENQEGDPEDYRYEYSAIIRALNNYQTLNMRGGIIRLEGRMIAFTLASPQNSQAIDIHIEKADASIEGAYQMINNQFAMRECGKYQYINREEDLGIEGLRQAKLSYHPAFLTAKYKAVPV